MRKKLLALLLTAMLLFDTGLASTRAVLTKQAKLYTKASTRSTVYGTLQKGDEVTVLQTKGSVAKVQYNGKTLYMAKSALKKASETKETAPVRMTTLSDARAYKSRSTSSKSVSVKKGTTVSVYETDGEWYKIKKNNTWCYLPSSAFEAEKTVSKKTAQKTNVYKSYSFSSMVLGSVKAGTILTVLAEKGEWVKVQKGSSVGWVPSSAFATSAAISAPETAEQPSAQKETQVSSERNSAKVEQVIDLITEKLGMPYVYSASGPYSFDCSGLMLYAFRRVGISLAHSAYTQGYGARVRLTMEQLQRGDLVFFNTNSSDSDMCDHVGIYLGDGHFIHASSGKGKVIVSDLTTGYYASVFSWGRKVL